MVSRTNREPSAEDIGRIADTHHAWRGEDAGLKRYGDVPGFPYEDVPGLCAAAGPSWTSEGEPRWPHRTPCSSPAGPSGVRRRPEWADWEPESGPRSVGARTPAAIAPGNATTGPITFP